MEDTTYKDDLLIDKHDLVIEWEWLPTLFMKWSEKYADSMLERDKAKARLELKYSELDMDARMFPERFGIDKVTEASVKAGIIASRAYKFAQEEYLESIHKANILSSAKSGMEMKKTALDNITKLHISGYYQTQTNIPEKDRVKSRKESSKRLKKKLSPIS